MLQVQYSSNMNQLSKKKFETCIQEIEQEIEASFNRINDNIDQIFVSYASSDALKLQSSLLSKYQVQSTIQIPSISIDLCNQLAHEINPLVQTIFSKEMKKEGQSLNEKHSKQIYEVQQELYNQLVVKKKEYDSIIQMKQEEIQKIKIKQQQEQNINFDTPQQNLKPITYELIQANSIKQNGWCCAVAINKDNTIVVAGCEEIIKVYQLKQGRLNEIQLLKEHLNQVFTLNFMKQSNNFVSGSKDSSIIIWQFNKNNQWTCQQKLNGHSDSIWCLLLNNNEDIIISGSRDIKFWDKEKGWLCQQPVQDHINYIHQLSLNQQQDKLISCSSDSQILVFKQSLQNKI